MRKSVYFRDFNIIESSDVLAPTNEFDYAVVAKRTESWTGKVKLESLYIFRKLGTNAWRNSADGSLFSEYDLYLISCAESLYRAFPNRQNEKVKNLMDSAIT